MMWLLIASAIFGMTVGVVMDLHRLIRVCFGVKYSGKSLQKLYEKPLPILRRPMRMGKKTRFKSVLLQVLIFFQDVILLVFAAVGITVLNYWLNQGRFRFYTVAAVVIGFLAYYFTIGKLVMLLSEGIVFFLRATLTILFILMSRPIVIFVEFFGKIAKKMSKNIQNALAKKRKRVYNKHNRKRMLQQASQGFLQNDV